MRGSLRHVIAAQIMWFQERSAAREMRFVLLHLQESYARAGLGSAREILLHSQLIHDQFQLDNANDLTMGVHTAGSAMTAGTVLEALGTRIGSQEQLITTLSSQVMALTAQITKLSQIVLQTQQTLNQGAAGVDGAAGAGAVDVGSTAGVGGASGVTGAAGATGTPSHPQMPAELKNFDFKDKAGDTDAQEAYINIMERKGVVPIAGLSQPRVTEYNHLRDMFNAVATSLERNFMLNTKNELGERKKKAQEIQDRLKNKFKDALRPHIDSRGPKAVQGALKKMPPSLSRTHMRLSAFNENLRTVFRHTNMKNFHDFLDYLKGGAPSTGTSDAIASGAATTPLACSSSEGPTAAPAAVLPQAEPSTPAPMDVEQTTPSGMDIRAWFNGYRPPWMGNRSAKRPRTG